MVLFSPHLLIRRRREDPANFANPAAPGLGVRASALALSVLLKGSLDMELPETARVLKKLPQPSMSSVAAVKSNAVDAANQATDSTPASSSSASLPTNSHLGRLSEEALTILFDPRRRSCHVLILNYFVALGGLESLLKCFSQVGVAQNASAS